VMTCDDRRADICAVIAIFSTHRRTDCALLRLCCAVIAIFPGPQWRVQGIETLVCVPCDVAMCAM